MGVNGILSFTGARIRTPVLMIAQQIQELLSHLFAHYWCFFIIIIYFGNIALNLVFVCDLQFYFLLWYHFSTFSSLLSANVYDMLSLLLTYNVWALSLLIKAARCDCCKSQGTLKERVQWRGEMKHFCDQHCLLRFYCQQNEPNMTTQKGPENLHYGMYYGYLKTLYSSFF